MNINAASLAAGTYQGQIAILPASGSAINVPVTLTVQAVPATLSADPASLQFVYQLGESSLPAVQSISVFSKPSGLNFAAAASSTGNWLSVASGGSTPGSVAVSVDVSKLGAGTYMGTVTISSATASSVTVPVAITIANAAPAVLSVSPGTETFSLAQGSASTGGQVTVSDTGGGTLQFTAQAASDKGWLALNGSGSGSSTPSAPVIAGVHGQSVRSESGTL